MNLRGMKMEKKFLFLQLLIPIPRCLQTSLIPNKMLKLQILLPLLKTNRPTLVKSPKIRTYVRQRKKAQPKVITDRQPNDQLETGIVPIPDPATDPLPVDSHDTNLPIALQKGKHSCNEHPIERCVLYNVVSSTLNHYLAACSLFLFLPMSKELY